MSKTKGHGFSNAETFRLATTLLIDAVLAPKVRELVFAYGGTPPLDMLKLMLEQAPDDWEVGEWRRHLIDWPQIQQALARGVDLLQPPRPELRPPVTRTLRRRDVKGNQLTVVLACRPERCNITCELHPPVGPPLLTGYHEAVIAAGFPEIQPFLQWANVQPERDEEEVWYQAMQRLFAGHYPVPGEIGRQKLYRLALDQRPEIGEFFTRPDDGHRHLFRLLALSAEETYYRGVCCTTEPPDYVPGKEVRGAFRLTRRVPAPEQYAARRGLPFVRNAQPHPPAERRIHYVIYKPHGLEHRNRNGREPNLLHRFHSPQKATSLVHKHPDRARLALSSEALVRRVLAEAERGGYLYHFDGRQRPIPYLDD